MKAVKNLNSSDILTIDIETVRIEKDYIKLSKDHQDAWKYKLKNEGTIDSEEVVSEKWMKMSSLYAEFSKVCAISMTYLSGDKLKCKKYAGTDEKAILSEFFEDLQKFTKHNPNYKILGHAVKYFDIPFLCKRYVINRLEIPSILDEGGAKPWEMKNVDTNELWRSFGTGPGSSLQALCVVLDIPISKVDLVGDEVGEAFYRGEIDRVSIYCSLDTIATFNVFRVFKGEPTFSFEEVIYVN